MERNDLAAKMPEKLAQMKDIFLIEAAKNKALPIGRGLWIPFLHPELRIAPAYTQWTFAGLHRAEHVAKRRHGVEPDAFAQRLGDRARAQFRNASGD